MKDLDDRGGAARRLEEAARWRVRLAESGGSCLQFDIWLGQDGNRAAWEQTCRAWDVFEGAAGAPELAAALQAARADAARARGRLTLHRLARPLQAAAAIILLTCLAAGGGAWWLARPDDYRTGAGERRVAMLADGSRLSLDSNSEVTVKFSAHQRLLHLLRGQARFDVAHDRSRPFSVIAGSQRVIATGTAFNIDMAGPSVLITLIEGHVVVLNDADGGRESLSGAGRIELQAGQQLAAAAGRTPQIMSASIPRVTAWTAGQLIFDNEPLSSVVDRVNRYSETRIVVGDPAIGALRISGVFNTGDPQGFVTIVTRYLRVRAVSEDSHTIALQSTTR